MDTLHTIPLCRSDWERVLSALDAHKCTLAMSIARLQKSNAPDSYLEVLHEEQDYTLALIDHITFALPE